MSKARIIADYAGTGAATDLATQTELNAVSTVASAALPKAGGTMSGNIVMGDDTSIGIGDSAERIEFDGDGDISVMGANLGVGTATPTNALLEVVTDNENVARFDGLQGNIDFRYGSDIEFDRAGTVYVTANNASGELQLRTGGQNARLHIDETGNVGIGEVAPSSPLEITKTGAGVQNLIKLNNNRGNSQADADGCAILVEGAIADNADATTYGKIECKFDDVSQGSIDSSWRFTNYVANNGVETLSIVGGNVGIGLSAPDEKLTVRGLIKAHSGNDAYYSKQGYMSFDAYHGGDAGDGWSSTIHNTNINTNGAYFRWRVDLDSTTTEHFRIAKNGDLTATDTTSSISDERLKENIIDYTYSLDTFKKYQPKIFDWKNPQLHGDRNQQIGFVAQNIEVFEPRWIRDFYINEKDEPNADYEYVKDTNGVIKTSKLGQTDAMYISIIQQLISKIETLETKVTALENA